MKRAGILAPLSLKSLESYLLNRVFPSRSLHTQVSRFSHFSPLFKSSPQKHSYASGFLNSHPKLYYSTKTDSIVKLIRTIEWSEDLVTDLEKSHSTPLPHEMVMYVLKMLERNPQKASHFFNWVTDKHGFKPSFTVYSLMLRILGNKETMNEFWELTRKLLKDGCEVDGETFATVMTNLKNAKMLTDANTWADFHCKVRNESLNSGLVKDVVAVMLKSDWNDGAKKKLEELKFTLSDNIMLRIFWALRQIPSKALCFFHWAEEQIGYKHSAVTYNRILRILAQEDSIGDFWSIVKQLKAAGHHIDIDTYYKLSKQLQKNKMIKDALELYELMMDSPYLPSEGNCIALLRHFSLTVPSEPNLVPRVLDKYAATGRPLSKDMYNFYHKFWASAGKLDEAEKVLETMRNAGYEPDKVTYSHLVYGLCKVGKLEEACRKLDEMEALGCVPDIQTWTLLIQGHFAIGEADQALKCFSNMVEKNIEVNACLSHVLVNGLCRNKRVDIAYKLLSQKLQNINIIPSQAAYGILIEKLLEERKLEQATNLLRTMDKFKFTPHSEPFVDYISKFGTVEDAIEYFRALEDPSSPAHFHVLQAFVKENRKSEARYLFYKCPDQVRNHKEILKLFAPRRFVNYTA